MSEHRSGPPLLVIADAQNLFSVVLAQALQDSYGIEVVPEQWYVVTAPTWSSTTTGCWNWTAQPQ